MGLFIWYLISLMSLFTVYIKMKLNKSQKYKKSAPWNIFQNGVTRPEYINFILTLQCVPKLFLDLNV